MGNTLNNVERFEAKVEALSDKQTVCVPVYLTKKTAKSLLKLMDAKGLLTVQDAIRLSVAQTLENTGY